MVLFSMAKAVGVTSCRKLQFPIWRVHPVNIRCFSWRQRRERTISLQLARRVKSQRIRASTKRRTSRKGAGVGLLSLMFSVRAKQAETTSGKMKAISGMKFGSPDF